MRTKFLPWVAFLPLVIVAAIAGAQDMARGRISAAAGPAGATGATGAAGPAGAGWSTDGGSVATAYRAEIDAGLYANGPVWIDGGTFINSTLTVDGGVTGASFAIGSATWTDNGTTSTFSHRGTNSEYWQAPTYYSGANVLTLESAATDAQTSSTVAALNILVDNVLTTGDLALKLTTGGATKLSVTYAGGTNVAGLSTVAGLGAGTDRVDTTLVCLNGAGCTEGWSAAAGVLTTKYSLGSVLTFSGTAPTSPVACTTPTITHGTTTSFQADVGGSCTTENTFVFTVPATTNGMRCTGDNITTPTTRVLAQSAGWSGTTITMTNYSRTLGNAQVFGSGDDLVISCTGR